MHTRPGQFTTVMLKTWPLPHKLSKITPEGLGPVVQNIVSLTSSLMVKMLTVLVSTISNSQVFLLKNVSSFCKCKSYSHFFGKNIFVHAIFNNQSFNDTLINDIVSFEQLGPGCKTISLTLKSYRRQGCITYILFWLGWPCHQSAWWTLIKEYLL